jgi:hypothetical protein
MFNNLTALTLTHALCVDPADTAAATSAYIDVRGYEGQIGVIVHNGTIGAGGTLTPTFLTATDGSATGEAAVVPLGGALTARSTSNDPLIEMAVFNVEQLKGYLKIVGTVATDAGPVSYSIIGKKKYAG